MSLRKLFSIKVISVLALLVLQSNIQAEDWITEEVLKQLTEVRQELKQLKGEISSLKQEVKNLRRSGGKRANPVVTSVEFGDLPRLGSKDSPIMIVEFSEFQCPFCSRHFKQTMPLIKANYLDTNKVQYVMRDFPLSFHKDARGAAIAVRCAARQSESAYWAMHHELLEKGSPSLNTDSYNKIAQKLSLDMDTFSACLDDKTVAGKVDADIAYGQRVGVSGTPAFFIGRVEGNKIVDAKRLVGAQHYSRFFQVIDSFLDKKSIANLIRKP